MPVSIILLYIYSIISNNYTDIHSSCVIIINSSIGYNLSVVVDSCNTIKALIDCECYIILFVCYKGVTKSFSSRYSRYINSGCKYEDIIGSGEQHRMEHLIHNGSTPIYNMAMVSEPE